MASGVEVLLGTIKMYPLFFQMDGIQIVRDRLIVFSPFFLSPKIMGLRIDPAKDVQGSAVRMFRALVLFSVDVNGY
jgi:hypothetical protein